jgi:hypothetical protein
LAATVVVKEINGAPGSKVYTTVDNASNKARYKTKDEVTSDLNYPCVIPTSGFNYSYWKSHCLAISGTYTQITNLRWYSAGDPSWDLGTSGMVMVAQRSSGDHGCPDASYAQATGTQGTTGYYLFDATNGHSYFKSGVGATPVHVGTYISSSMMNVDTTSTYTGTTYTYNVVTQVKIDTAANGALQGLKTATTYRYIA